MKALQKICAISAILEAIIYISAFIFFGLYWHYPSEEGTAKQIAYLTENQFIFSLVNLFMYLVFGVLLSILTLSLYDRFKAKSPAIIQVATIFGVIWVALVIAAGMILNVGLDAIIKLSVSEPERALTIWNTISLIVEGLGGGNEFVGGIWVLLVSIAALKSGAFYKSLNYLGVFVGVVGIATIYPAEVLTEIFGISQIVWFICLGIAMLKNKEN
jgi:hypothetical protein